MNPKLLLSWPMKTTTWYRLATYPRAALCALLVTLCPGAALRAAEVPAVAAADAAATAPPPAQAPTDAPPASMPGVAGTTPDAPAGAPGAPSAAAPGGPPASGDAGAPTAGAGGAPAEAAGTRSLDEQVQDLKKDVVDLNKDLFVLEEELLFPANTQVAVFVSIDVGDFFALDSVTLKIDNREVKDYLYTPREVAALLKGGVQQLYVGNLKAGQHELVAFFNGKGPNERNYRRAATLKFEKGVGAKYLELKITDRARAQQPEFEIKDWE